MIVYNCYYKSPVLVDLHDQYFWHNYLIFSKDNHVRIGILKEEGFTELGSGEFKIVSDKIMFAITSLDDNHQSNWFGIIKPEGIEIEIKNADFNDVEGFYELQY